MSKRQKAATVPLGTEDPIGYLTDHGMTPAQVAVAWDYNDTTMIHRYRRYECIPNRKLAAKMAVTFGWSPGQVLDHWTARVKVAP